MKPKSIQVATTLPIHLVNAIDKVADRKYQPRAEWLRDAILKAAEQAGMPVVEHDEHAGKTAKAA